MTLELFTHKCFKLIIKAPIMTIVQFLSGHSLIRAVALPSALGAASAVAKC